SARRHARAAATGHSADPFVPRGSGPAIHCPAAHVPRRARLPAFHHRGVPPPLAGKNSLGKCVLFCRRRGTLAGVAAWRIRPDRPGRPVVNTLLQLADHGEVHGLIVVHPNRVSRNHADSGAFVQRLVEGAIPCLDTTSGKRYTGADSNDIFMLTLEGAMSWKDSRDKGDRILQAMRMRAAEGRHMGPARLGYRAAYRPDGTKVLELMPEQAAVIRRVFELAA